MATRTLVSASRRPGIAMRFADYAAAVGINFSTLKHMARSPLHYRYALQQSAGGDPGHAPGQGHPHGRLRARSASSSTTPSGQGIAGETPISSSPRDAWPRADRSCGRASTTPPWRSGTPSEGSPRWPPSSRRATRRPASSGVNPSDRAGLQGSARLDHQRGSHPRPEDHQLASIRGRSRHMPGGWATSTRRPCTRRHTPSPPGMGSDPALRDHRRGEGALLTPAASTGSTPNP